MPEMTKIEPSIKNKKAIEVSKKMGKRYSLLDAMMMGRRLGIDWTKEKFTVGDLLVGMHYELEHGKVDPETNVTNDNPKKTAKVAWAHLKERPDYYVQLMKMDPPHKLEKKANELLDGTAESVSSSTNKSRIKKALKGYADTLLGKNMKASKAERLRAKAFVEDTADWHEQQYNNIMSTLKNNHEIPYKVRRYAETKALDHLGEEIMHRSHALDMPTGPAAKERLKTYGTRAATVAALAAGTYGAYKGIKKLSDKRKKRQAEKTAHAQLNEMVKEAASLTFSQQYTPQMNSGQFASEMQNKSNAFMSGIKAKKPTTSTDEYLGRAISDAKASAIEKATVVGSPEYKAARNNENLKATINRKTDAALNKNRAEDSLKAFDKQFGKRKVKIGEPAQDAASKVYSYTEGGARAHLDRQVAAKNREKLINAGGKALIGAGIVAAGIGTYKALKKRKENNQRAATPPYNYPQPYPQMMQHTAFSLLDNLYFEKTAEDEVVDFKEQIPDLILEAKYKPEIKKEETPGGKMTPSKYVQRKNKQRYNA